MMSYLADSTWEDNRRQIVGLVSKDESAKLLDCGCADGEFTRKVALKLGTKSVFGIEIEEKKARLAEQNGIKCYQCDLNKYLPLEKESFDLVLANQIIEHLHSTDTFVREIHRILRPGGQAIVSTPNLASVHYIFCLMLGMQPFSAHVSDEIYLGNPFNPSDKVEYGGRAHLRIFAYQGLKELFKHHGFQVETIRGSGYLPLFGPPANLISRIDPRHAVFLTIKAKKS